MSYQLSRLDLVVNNATTQITVNTNPSTQGYINGDIIPQDNVINIASTNNRFVLTSDYPAATVKSTSKALSLTDLKATELGTVNVPISEPVGGNGLNNNLNISYDEITYSIQLLTAVGANSTSTTLSDLSINNFTITNNAAATVSSVGPFSNSYAYASLRFNGTTQYLSVAANTAFQFYSNDFTIECWFYWDGTVPTGATQNSLINNIVSADNNSWDLQYFSGQWRFITWSPIPIQGVGSAFVGNTWNHIAVTRHNNVGNIWLNGVSVGRGDLSGYNFSSLNTLKIGYDGYSQFWNGYISNVRIVKGAALYRGNFLPPASNFSSGSVTTTVTKVNAITTTYTKLTYLPLNIKLFNSLKYTAPTGQTEVYDRALTVNSYRAAATSNINVISSQATMNVADRPDFYITGSDAPIVLSTDGRGAITTQLGGALVFDGNLDTLTYASNPQAFNLSADFTIEFWLKPTPTWGQTIKQRIMGNYGSTRNGWTIYKGSDPDDCRKLTVRFNHEYYSALRTTDVLQNVWQHYALVRSGSTLSWWRNGALNATGAAWNADMLSDTPFVLGYGTVGIFNDTDSAKFQISNLRIVKGTALYTSSFTPLAPLVVVTNTTFLLPVANSATPLLETVSGSTLTSNSVQFTNLGPVINGTISNTSYSPGAYVSTAGTPAHIKNITKYNDPAQVEGYFSSFIPAHTGEEDRVQAWV